MENNQLYNLLNLPAEVIHNLDKYGSSGKNTFNIDIEDLIQNTSLVKELDKLIAGSTGQDEDGTKILWEELNIARQSFDEYQKRGIPDRIFIDTMKFCTRFLNEYYRTYSCYRFAWGWWFPRQLALLELLKYESMAILDWVFPRYNKISEELPENTSLQTNMKKYLLGGNKPGWTKGVLKSVWE